MKGRSTLSLYPSYVCEIMKDCDDVKALCEYWVVSFSLSQFHAIAPASSFYECWDETLNYCCAADVCNRTNAFTTSRVWPLFYVMTDFYSFDSKNPTLRHQNVKKEMKIISPIIWHPPEFKNEKKLVQLFTNNVEIFINRFPDYFAAPQEKSPTSDVKCSNLFPRNPWEMHLSSFKNALLV